MGEHTACARSPVLGDPAVLGAGAAWPALGAAGLQQVDAQHVVQRGGGLRRICRLGVGGGRRVGAAGSVGGRAARDLGGGDRAGE
jgi:hypothetical protein